jgi:hypothetical protein
MTGAVLVAQYCHNMQSPLRHHFLQFFSGCSRTVLFTPNAVNTLLNEQNGRIYHTIHNNAEPPQLFLCFYYPTVYTAVQARGRLYYLPAGYCFATFLHLHIISYVTTL